MIWSPFSVGIPAAGSPADPSDPPLVAFRGRLAPWVGGASAPASGGGSTPATVAFRGPLAFWLGGANAGAIIVIPPAPSVGSAGHGTPLDFQFRVDPKPKQVKPLPPLVLPPKRRRVAPKTLPLEAIVEDDDTNMRLLLLLVT